MPAQPAKPAAPAKPATTAGAATAAAQNDDAAIYTAPVPLKASKVRAPEAPPTPIVKSDELFQSLDYPELQVIPSASERLRIQASDESRGGWYSYWPVQTSSLALITTALLSSSHEDTNLSQEHQDDAKRGRNISLAVGSSWIVGTAILSLSRPYRSGLKRISEFPAATKADRLRRERLAEEQLQYPGEIASKIKYAAFATNLVASLAMLPHQNSSGEVIIGVSALAAFLPLIFDTTYESTYEKHLEYKRRIYVPLVSFNSGYSTELASRVDKLTMTWSF